MGHFPFRFIKTISTSIQSVSCFPYNEASLKLIEKLGFVYEGKEHKGLNHAVYGPIDVLCYYKDKDE